MKSKLFIRLYKIPILEPLTHNEFTVKDSFSFAKEIMIVPFL